MKHLVPIGSFLAILGLPAFLSLAVFSRGFGDDGKKATNQESPLKLPDGWSPHDPLPIEKSNCVRCHLTAGRELTVPVRDFARSAHDRAKLSCNDCHGGNTDDDTTAHEHEFDFIGTKLSAHIAACADCHTDEAEAFRKGPHFWDLSKRINRDYPVCIDCHGNHDVGKPPAEFSLINVCTDCHKKFTDDFPETAAIVAENDRLWRVLREVHAKNKAESDPTPQEFRRDLASVRSTTARLVHSAGRVSTEQAEALNGRARRLRERMETWLKARE
jgi:hypothetical protein